ncbi:hypothetical protein FDUTEX481_04274 [Tolypothrix sp. PCC 7601]|nr:hypothetical protein FDUTEX481_04274 [Tolypothrix sp. PCC 7601]
MLKVFFPYSDFRHIILLILKFKKSFVIRSTAICYNWTTKILRQHPVLADRLLYTTHIKGFWHSIRDFQLKKYTVARLAEGAEGEKEFTQYLPPLLIE